MTTFLLTALLSTTILAVTNAHAQGNPLKIVFFGDSLTAGYGVGEPVAFPALVERQLKTAGYNVSVINAGVSGDTSAGGARRIDWILQQPLDILVVALGGNDALRGLPTDDTRQNLQTIIEKAKARYPDSVIVLAEMKAPPSMGAAYETSFNSIYKELAKSTGAQVLPFLLENIAGDSTLNLPDGLHPNEAGHLKIADLVSKELLPLVKQRTKDKP